MQKPLICTAAGLVVAGVGAFVLWRVLSAPAAPPPRATGPERIAYGDPEINKVATPPPVRFREATTDAGITFTHYHGGYGQKLLPETMGSGVLVFDYNGDGRMDILFVNSCAWPHHRYESPPPKARLALYANTGAGRFRDVTAEVGLGALECYGMGAVAGDIDNDGDPDLFLTALNRAFLFRNDRGERFTDITSAAGLHCPGWSSAAAFLDYDRDGRLDLFVGHYVQWAPEKDLVCKLDGKNKSYCQPMLYEGEHCQLFRNRGGDPPQFEDVSAAAGVQVLDVRGVQPASKCLGVAVHDYNDDGWPDIAVANDTTPNFLFRNNQDGTFTNVGTDLGVALLNDKGQARGAMGIHWGYYRDGETLGLAIANFADEPNSLLRYNRLQGGFIDCAVSDGVHGPSLLLLKFGLFFFDYDLDGRLDLFTHNGHIEPDVEKILGRVKYAQPAQLFWNTGLKAGCYRAVEPEHAGPDLFKPRVGRGCAYGDFDGDGDLDIALSNNNQPAALLINECPETAKAVRLRFRGVEANRDGYGCRVKLWAGGRLQQAELNSGGSYLSQNEAVLTFGLGTHEQAERVEVRWPTRQGRVTRLEHLDAGFTYVIDEQKGIVERIPFRKPGQATDN
jgi:hypothetical protein